jgi:hypothetical protein
MKPRPNAQRVPRRVYRQTTPFSQRLWCTHACLVLTMRCMPDHASVREHMSRLTSARAITGSCRHKDPTRSPESSRETPSKFSTGPARISDKDRVRLLHRLNSTDQPFRVNTVLRLPKGKRSGKLVRVQENPFDERLAVKYTVKPWESWKSLRRYKSFTGKKEHNFGSTDGHGTVLTDGESSGI